MSVLGIGALVAAVLVIGSVVLPAVAERHNAAEDLTEATDATVRKADDLADRFGQIVPNRVEAAANGDASGDSTPGAVSAPGNDASDPPVVVALQELADLDGRPGGIHGDERIIAVENLRDVWTPRYRQAQEQHRRLALRVEHADRAAGRYFETQEELTRQISNPEDRVQAEQGDRAEREIYRRWREQAGRTMAQSERIMVDLRDMDIRITKQLLSANFAALYHDFQEVPVAIDALHRDLERFRARSEEISATFEGSAR